MHEPVEQADGGGGVLGQEPGPMDSEHQRLAMPSECCSVAAATTRNSSRIPMSFSGAKPGLTGQVSGTWCVRTGPRIPSDMSAASWPTVPRSGAGGASSAPSRRSGPESATR